jgi:hypothetical protein
MKSPLPAIALILLLFTRISMAGNVYQEPDAFINAAFNGKPPATQVLWLNTALKAQLEAILQHPYTGLRVRYWLEGKRTAWILDEIGKEKPITTGIIINNNRIEKVRVLVFRESRGWEVGHTFFTQQFDHAGLDKANELDRTIDNISGATMSVRAVTKLARIALLLNQQVITDGSP